MYSETSLLGTLFQRNEQMVILYRTRQTASESHLCHCSVFNIFSRLQRLSIAFGRTTRHQWYGGSVQIASPKIFGHQNKPNSHQLSNNSEQSTLRRPYYPQMVQLPIPTLILARKRNQIETKGYYEMKSRLKWTKDD